MLRVEEKKYDEAWQDLLACHRLGRLVGSGGGTLIEGLVGIALDNDAARADVAFIEHARLDTKQIQKCAADLRNLPPLPAMADKVGQAERFMFLQAIMLIDRDGSDMLDGLAGKGDRPFAIRSKQFPDFVNWDPALRKGNQFYNRMTTALRLKDRTLREKHLSEVEHDIRSLKANISGIPNLGKAVFASESGATAVTNVIGDILISLLIPATSKVQHAADRAAQTQDNLQVAFALAAYHRDDGSYPKSLDLLTPKYLASVPGDLFTGKALIYRPQTNGYLLYSVGMNGKDDGGRGQDDEPPGDDLVVRVPGPK
jgi:hypothetical protein